MFDIEKYSFNAFRKTFTFAMNSALSVFYNHSRTCKSRIEVRQKRKERKKERQKWCSNVRIPYVCHASDITCLINIFLVIHLFFPSSSVSYCHFSYRVSSWESYLHLCLILAANKRPPSFQRQNTISVHFLF